LVPLFVYAALGCATLLKRHPQSWARVAAFSYSGSIIALATVFFLDGLPATMTRPFEANREAAAAVVAADPEGKIPVLLNTHSPDDLLYYLPRGTDLVMPGPGLEQRLCAHHGDGVIFVEQPFRIAPVDASCLVREGATAHRFVQRGRGGKIVVWVLRTADRRSLTDSAR
jgi:hypothetical protein